MKSKNAEALIEILEEEYAYYCKLNELAAEKKETIIENDIDNLTRLVKEDEKIITQLNQLEAKRSELLVGLQGEEDSEEGLNYRQLMGLMNDNWEEKFTQVRSRLLEIIDELYRRNDQNRVLLEEAIKLNNFSFNMLKEAVNPTKNLYNKKRGKDKDDMPRLVDRRG